MYNVDNYMNKKKNKTTLYPHFTSYMPLIPIYKYEMQDKNISGR